MFYNREEAGQLLGEMLRDRDLREPLVLAIPRGGMLVGAKLAEALHADLDLVLARKLRAPWQRELAIGSVSEDGRVHLVAGAEEIPGVTEAYLEEETALQRAEIAERRDLIRRVRPPAPIRGRSVIVTDDGLATGSTMIAALEAIRAEEPHELIVAIPVAPAGRLAEVRARCDHLVCLYQPHVYYAVGQFYEDFSEVDDDEVLSLLRDFRKASLGSTRQ